MVDENIPRTLLQLRNGRAESGLRALLEARRPVEMEIARLVGQRADAADLERMEESIARLAAQSHKERSDAG